MRWAVVIGWLCVQLTINWDQLFRYKNPEDEGNKFRNNDAQLIVNGANNNPITTLFRGQQNEIHEQKRDGIIYNYPTIGSDDIYPTRYMLPPYHINSSLAIQVVITTSDFFYQIQTRSFVTSC